MDFKKDLANLYENISKEDGTEIVEDSTNKFSINDYTKLISEGSGHGDEKAVQMIIKQALKDGLIRGVKDTKKGWILYSAKDNSQFTTHKGEGNFHHIRRYLEGLKKISLTSSQPVLN